MERRHKRRTSGKPKKKKRFTALYISCIVLFLIAVGGYLFRKQLTLVAFDWFVSPTLESKLEKSYQPRQSGEQQQQETVAYRKEPFSVLLLGTDQRPNEKARGRSDTVMYAVVRPAESRVLLVSIPRDTYVQIAGHDPNRDGEDDFDKLGHAYAFGGEDMSMATVEKLMEHKADYYATINFQGIQEAVNAVGGVVLPIDKPIENKNPLHIKFRIEAGKPLYNGEEAMYYVRYREDSDFNRTKRQQIFLNAMADKLLNINGITKIPELLDIMGANFKTDMEPTFITGLGKQAISQGNPQISSFTITGEGFKKKGLYYDRANEQELEYARLMIANWLDSDTTPQTLRLPDKQDIQ
ncbi:LCP family protein [Paenibacillus polymyxa]|uniref:LCP family protein n=1 Tax=Paenibacillus TaxID=44249 RepID=UPI0004D3A35F|nr:MULTISPECIES: LCP family protein [Paenibacillus]KEO79091.1 transcriptional regulator [Paenibacillus polymyxa]MCH6187618.1 LCP family protein [Paenibacillus polymyxa]MCP3777576.1 LCP family protein [Paenibacillus sp. MZ03-122A]MDY8045251.1 LCP family protein [Paenibacillus polymyxa]WRL57104.1 LCP family protein [Paenibacillus polymyxa]